MPEIEALSFLLEGKKDLVIAEIGIFKAGSTLFALNNYDVKRYYAIDPFQFYKEYNEESLVKHFKERGMDNCYLDVVEKLSKYKNVTLIRDFSHNAVNLVKDGELNFCFIDGNHHYEYIYKDIELWFPKVKENGILSGDDAGNEEVDKAVSYFFKDKKYDVFVGKRSWFVCKKTIYW